MDRLRRTLSALVGVVFAGVAHADLGTVVEYYHPGIKHYFITGIPAEIAALDAGQVGPWVRTGGQFSAYTEPGEGRVAVCRFFAVISPTSSTHFYTAIPSECDLVKQNPRWTYEGNAFYIPLPVNGSCPSDQYPVYRTFFSDEISDFNHRFTVDPTSAGRQAKKTGWTPEGIVMCAPVSDRERDADVVRLLEQATAGPSESAVAAVRARGVAGWIDDQLALNVTRYTQRPHFDRPPDGTTCIDDPTPPVTPEKYCKTNKVDPWPVGWEFFRQAKTAPDQLRLRMAHVWHQIFVVSDGNGTHAYAHFQQLLRDNVFGTFENLLTRYTLSPMLGEFQNWIHNVPEHDGIKPNENFARELMQLFTIGVDVLNEDGTPKLDAQGHRIPAYGQADIEALARILTGYSFPVPPGTTGYFGSPRYYFGDMLPYEQFHDKGVKYALGGRINLYPGGSASSEVRTMIRALVDHPNTPPFVSRQLIQKTVTSSPTPEYVARVAAVFRNNGAGVRGDLAAVTRAILLDPEARGARKIDPEYGRLREPALYWTAMIRALDVTTDGYVPYSETAAMGQVLFLAPSVFNYYPSDFTLAGSATPAPEFGIYGTDAFLWRLNILVNLLTASDQPWAQHYYGPQPFLYDATGTRLPALSSWAATAGDVGALVDRVDALFLHGAMPPDMRSTLVKAISRVPATDRTGRVKLALRLVLPSADYQVQK